MLLPHQKVIAIACAIIVSTGLSAAATDDSGPKVIATIPVGTNPVAVAAYSDGNSGSLDKDRVYVANEESFSVTAINAESKNVIKHIDVPGKPRGIAVNRDNGMVYVTNWSATKSGAVSVIDPKTLSVTATIYIGRQPRGVTVDAHGLIYVTLTAGASAGLVVIDPIKREVIKSYSDLGDSPEAVAVNPYEGKAYIANGATDNVSVIDLANDKPPFDKIPAGANPMAISSQTYKATVYVANTGSDNISVIDGKQHSLLDTIPVGKKPTAVAEDSQISNKLYVANSGSDTVMIISSSSPRKVEGVVAVGSQPSALSADQERSEVWVTNRGSNTVSVVRPS